MKKLGKAVSLKGNKVVLKTDKELKKGDKIYDEKRRLIGNVVKFLDKEDGGYPLVSPRKPPKPILGEKLYG